MKILKEKKKNRAMILSTISEFAFVTKIILLNRINDRFCMLKFMSRLSLFCYQDRRWFAYYVNRSSALLRFFHFVKLNFQKITHLECIWMFSNIFTIISFKKKINKIFCYLLFFFSSHTRSKLNKSIFFFPFANYVLPLYKILNSTS